MNTFVKHAMHLAVIGVVAGSLAACGGSSSSGGGHEHEHGELLISQAGNNNISHVDEGEEEALTQAMSNSSATFVRSDNGEVAAIIDGPTIRFVAEETILAASFTGSQVVGTSGHFSILNAGTSTLVELAELENLAPATETSGVAVSEVFPALVLDEVHDLKMLFVAGEARVYEGTTLEQTLTCTNPSSVAQGHHSVLITCDEGVELLQFEEDPIAGLTFASTVPALDGTDSNYVWSSTEHVFAGYEPGTTNYALIHVEEDGTVDQILSSDLGSYPLAGNICAAHIEAEDEDFLFWLTNATLPAPVGLVPGGVFVALDHEGGKLVEIVVDRSTSSNCSDYHFNTGAKTAYVLDTNASLFHEIDIEEEGTSPAYHIHETLSTMLTDVADSVLLFEMDGDHGHSHD